MDKFDRMHVCNHSDDQGRYSYKLQPAMGEYAIRKLGDAVAELIGAEIESGKTLSDDWAEGSDKAQRMVWREKGLEYVSEAVSELKSDLSEEYNRLMAKVSKGDSSPLLVLICVQRLGFHDTNPSDNMLFFEALLDIMEENSLDFFHTFRTLCSFPGVDSPSFKDFLGKFVPLEEIPKNRQSLAHEEATTWFKKYEQRLTESETAAGQDAASRQTRMRAANPRFALRQWVLEEAIKRLEEKQDTAFLDLVMQMSINPFESYGEDGAKNASEEEEARLCGLGPTQMLGFQCSVSLQSPSDKFGPLMFLSSALRELRCPIKL